MNYGTGIEDRLSSRISGCLLLRDAKITHHNTICSTNDEGKAIIGARDYDGRPQIIFADEQTGGRGRHDRSWHSPPGGLYASFVISLPISALSPGTLSMAAGISACKTLREYLPETLIKWPNDCIYQDKKIAGILIEARVMGGMMNSVIGIGLNTNIKDFSSYQERGSRVADAKLRLEDSATSVVLETGEEADNIDCLASLARNLDYWCSSAKKNIHLLKHSYADVLAYKGVAVCVHHGSEKKTSGIMVGVDEHGALLLYGASGLERLLDGEIAIG